ncbi:DUF2724 domain-containing protein [Enterobacter cloacae]|nr:DUF2724 domain-containing protein [Enterobacter cloacae]
MLNNEHSFELLLVKRSPGKHFGHGWIAGKNGRGGESIARQIHLKIKKTV